MKRKEHRLTITEAAQLLGVSRDKVWRLLKKGVLTATVDPLDERRKLINESALLELKDRSKAA